MHSHVTAITKYNDVGLHRMTFATYSAKGLVIFPTLCKHIIQLLQEDEEAAGNEGVIGPG
jgi:hypothetical protein